MTGHYIFDYEEMSFNKKIEKRLKTGMNND
jgi:hypothetical protein